MNHYSVRINYNNIRGQIQQDYFHYLDMFYKILILYVVFNDRPELPLSQTLVLENRHYDDLLRRVIASGCMGRRIPELSTIDPTAIVDMQIYLEDFVRLKHNKSAINIYNLTIDEDYNVLITNKYFSRHAL